MKKLFTALCMAAIALGAAADTVYMVLPAAPEADGVYTIKQRYGDPTNFTPMEGQPTVLQATVDLAGFQYIIVSGNGTTTNMMAAAMGFYGNNWCYAQPVDANLKCGVYGIMKQVTVTCENTANWDKVIAYATCNDNVVEGQSNVGQWDKGLLLGEDGVEMSGESLTFLAPSGAVTDQKNWQRGSVSKIKFGDGNGNWTKEYDVTDGLQVTNGGSETGISEIAGGQGAAQYYNLQGQPVSQPQGGVYIRVNGNKATKVAL